MKWLVFLLLAGCATLGPSKIMESPAANDIRTVSTGDIFLSYENSAAVTDPLWGEIMRKGDRFDLVVVEITERKFSLQYSEYIWGHSGAYQPPGWFIKPGFNRRLDYDIAGGLIRFKDFEFEILGVEAGQIKYRRIK